MSNNPFFNNQNQWDGNYMPDTSYAPQTGGYVAGNRLSMPLRFSSIPGRTVNNLDEITPQEVPMDGSVSLFPQSDYSAIYAKTWTKEGRIATVKYVPEQQPTEPVKTPIEEHLDKFDQRFDRLEKMLSDRHKPRKPYNKPRQVKEEQTDV